MKTKVALSVISIIFVAMFLVGATGDRPVAAQHTPTAGPIEQGGWVFEGCWTYWSAGPCYDIYKDASGQYWKCKKCGQTTNPSPSTCSKIALQTLNIGYWCS